MRTNKVDHNVQNMGGGSYKFFFTIRFPRYEGELEKGELKED